MSLVGCYDSKSKNTTATRNATGKEAVAVGCVGGQGADVGELPAPGRRASSSCLGAYLTIILLFPSEKM